ncbi:UNVERIFIED_CONTAM: putative carboxylesterase SOBER1-like, partial [Sesamum latifolium]
MKSLPAKSVAVFAVTFGITISFVLLHHQEPSPVKPDPMARSFILWLHGLGDSGPANEPIKSLFTSPQFRNTKWSFPSAPSNPVTCN